MPRSTILPIAVDGGPALMIAVACGRRDGGEAQRVFGGRDRGRSGGAGASDGNLGHTIPCDQSPYAATRRTSSLRSGPKLRPVGTAIEHLRLRVGCRAMEGEALGIEVDLRPRLSREVAVGVDAAHQRGAVARA